MYGDYVKSRSSHDQDPIQSVLESELTKYPYKRKDDFQVIFINSHTIKNIYNSSFSGAPLQPIGFDWEVQVSGSTD